MRLFNKRGELLFLSIFLFVLLGCGSFILFSDNLSFGKAGLVMEVEKYDPELFDLPSGAIEVVEKRTEKTATFEVAPGKFAAVSIGSPVLSNSINKKVCESEVFLFCFAEAFWEEVFYSVLADSSGPNSPSNAYDDYMGMNTPWTNASNVTANDNSRATVDLEVDGVSNLLFATDFGFSITEGSTIDGIEVQVEQSSVSGDINGDTAYMVKGGMIDYGSDHGSLAGWNISEDYVDYGGDDDTWNSTTLSEVNDGYNFGFAINAGCNPGLTCNEADTARIDHIRMKVYYTAGDTTAPTVTNVTSSTSNGTKKIGDTISIQITFSEVVYVSGTPQLILENNNGGGYANYVSGTTTNTLTFTYTVVEGDSSGDLDYQSTSSLDTMSSTIADAASNSADNTLPSPGAAGSLGANKALVIDGISPTITTITSSTCSGTCYKKAGDTVSIQVVFSESVTVTGTPRLTLETGGTDALVNYASGSGSSTLTFTYTVGSGETSLDLNVNSLGLNGGTIRDAATNNASLAMPDMNNLADTEDIVIDTAAGTVTNVTDSFDGDGTYKTSDTLSIDVVFSEDVNVTGTPRITLETGASDAVVNYSYGSGSNTLTFSYTVSSGHNSADLDYVNTTSLALNSGTIKDLAGNNMTLTLATPGAAGSLGANKALVIDTTAPTITNVTSSTSNGNRTTGQTVSIQVVFSEAVAVEDVPKLQLETGTTDQIINYVSGSGTNTLTFTYTVQSGDSSTDLDYKATDSLTLPYNEETFMYPTIKDNVTYYTDSSFHYDAVLTLASPGAAGSLGANKAITINQASQSLTFSISDNTIGFGTLSISAARFATGDAVGSASEVEAHTLSAAANATSYVITLKGATLTHGSNGSYTITAIGGTNTASSTGTEQFGLRLAVNSGNGTATSPYAASGFAYAGNASTASQVVSGTGDSSTTVYSVRYISNISNTTEAGSYSTVLNYVATATF